MFFRSIALSCAVITACGGAASMAAAQSSIDNDVVIDQIGLDNSAVLTQSGQRNFAGSDALPLVQDGIYNDLEITQRGRDNTVGVTGTGLFQFGRLNNRDTFNTIVILQQSDENQIGSVRQSSLGSVVNGANSLSITQQSGDRNSVRSVRQIQEAGQAPQQISVVQTGRDNVIDRIEQRSNSVGRDGSNFIDVSILGAGNGGIRLSGFASEPNVADSSILQEADTVDPGIYGNKIVLSIIGDDNRFGLRQGGRMNDMGRLAITGNQNQLGLRQDGTENNIQMSVIEGDGNEIGIDQIVTNIAEVNLIGDSDDNRVYAFQQGTNTLLARIEGDTNTLRVRQDYLSGLGGENTAALTVLGDDNFADLEQVGSNDFVLGITGDRNNAGGPFTGVAARGGLTPGVFRQTGFRNDMAIAVTGNDNLTAATQAGVANVIVAVISGNANQAAIVQSSNANIANLVQSGSDNRAGIYQN